MLYNKGRGEMWIDRKKFMPSAKWLRHNKYVPDQVWAWTNGYGAGWKRLEDFLSDDSAECSELHAKFWAPIEVPDWDVEDTTAKPCICHPPVINITFGDVLIANESDADEFQARVIAAVRKALGQECEQRRCQTCHNLRDGMCRYDPKMMYPACYRPKR